MKLSLGQESLCKEGWFSAAKWLLIAYVPMLVLLVAARVQTKAPVDVLIRDPLSLGQLPYYAGTLSNIGVTIWCVTSTICIFSYFLLSKLYQNRVFANFLLAAGGISTLLFLDDFFLLHEMIFPALFGIHEDVLYAVYISLILLFLVTFRKVILKTDYILLLVALVFFGVSQLVDVSDAQLPAAIAANGGDMWVEDGLKLLGLVAWSVYFVRTAAKQLKLI